MGNTRVRKPRKAIEDRLKNQRHTGVPELEALTIKENQNDPALLAVPLCGTESASGGSLFSKNSAESLGSTSDQDTTYIEVRNTDTKGQAVFATRKIQAGTLILCENPIIRLTQAQEDADKDGNPHPEDQSALEFAFAALSKSEQKTYLKLFDSKKSDFTRVKSIYYSNCYNLSGANKPSKTSPGGSCIGLMASRINHSCIPNAQFSYDEASNRMMFHAIKPIARGKEITSNYDSIYELRAQRQRKQTMYYGFQCDCEACEVKTEFWDKSDERRRAMIEARKDVKECEKTFEEKGTIDNAHDPTHDLEKLENLLIKEGSIGMPLADLYKSMAKWAERRNDKKAVKKWREKELDVCRTCFGEQSLRVQTLRNRLDLID